MRNFQLVCGVSNEQLVVWSNFQLLYILVEHESGDYFPR